MDLKGIMLIETGQTKTNNIWFHLDVDSKKTNQTKKTEIDS